MPAYEVSIETQRAALLDRVHKADSTRSSSRNIVEGLNTDMAKLQHRVQFAKTTMTKATREAAAAITDISKFESRLLMDEISEALPRELRDMTYEFCWKEELKKYEKCEEERPWRAHDLSDDELDGVEIESGYNSDYCFPPHPRAKAFRPYPTPYFGNQDYVGYNVACEVAMKFYDIAPAYVESLDMKSLVTYLTRDIFCLGLVPRTRVKSVIFFLDMCRERAVRFERHLSKQDAEKASLAIVGIDRTKSLPSITFLFKEFPSTSVTALNWGETFYKRMKELGAKITIIYRHDKFKVGPINLGAIMDMPPSVRYKHFIEETRKQDPTNAEWVSKFFDSVNNGAT